MNNKDHNNIDDLFKDAFDQWEVPPGDHLWNNISEGIEEDVDRVFKEGLYNKEVQPSEKVWLSIKEHLPLSLWLKRRLNSLSIMAGVLVVGMLVILYVNWEEKPVTKPTEPAVEQPIANENPLPPMEIEIVADEEDILARDNSLENKIKSVKVKPEEEFVFDIDEEKMRKILEPLEPLPVESAMAGFKKNKKKSKDAKKDAENNSESSPKEETLSND